jgi:hypothetical protein
MSVLLMTAGFATAAHAATISNGQLCPKANASSTVKVKGVTKSYICTVNPAAATNPNIAKSGRTWTLKTCVSYYAQYKSALSSLKSQFDLINLLTEPDKTTALKGYNDGMATLNQTVAAIESNYCKTGL